MPRFIVSVDDEEFEVDATDEIAAQQTVQAQLDREDAAGTSAGSTGRGMRQFTQSLNAPPEDQGTGSPLIGAMKSAAEGGFGAFQSLLRLTPAGAFADEGVKDDAMEAMDEARASTERRGAAEKIGAAGEQIAEFMVPGAAAEKVIQGIPRFMGRQAARGGLAAAQQTVRQGGEVNAGTAAAGVAGAGFGAAGEAAAPIARALARSALKNAINFIQPRTEADRLAAGELARRFIDEDLMSMGRQGRGPLAARSEELKKSAYDDIEAYLIGHGNDPIDATNVLATSRAQRAPALPGGGSRRITTGSNKKADKIAADTEEAVLNMQTTSGPSAPSRSNQVPLSAANEEKMNLDEIVYRNRVKPTRSDSQVKAVADSWRSTIADAHPQLGDMNKRYSELAQIADLLEQADRLAIMPHGSDTAAAAGAGIAGRFSIPAMKGLGWLQRNPKFQSLSGESKLKLAELLLNPGMKAEFMKSLTLAAIPEPLPSH